MLIIAAVIAAALAGGVAAERHWGERAGITARAALGLTLRYVVPVIVFFNLARLEINADVGLGIVLAWLAIAITGVLAYQAATRGLHLERPQAGAVINASLHPNSGYLGLPLCAAALGTHSLDEAVAYDVLVGLPTLLLGVFGVGAAMGTRAGETVRDRVRAFFTRNPPLYAAILALLVPDALAPDVLVDASRILVFALLPVGFVTVGITLAEEHLRFPPPLPPPAAVAIVLRLLVAPALLLAFAAPLIDIPDAYLILAAMPAGLNGLVVAHEYGLDLGIAASAIAWGTALVVPVATAVSVLT
jgi:predicted permease